jgi:hypothetical protein
MPCSEFGIRRHYSLIRLWDKPGNARSITLCLDSEMNSRHKSHDFASSAHWVTGTDDDPKRTMSHRDSSLPSRTLGHRERSLLNPGIGQSGTQMPQIAHWVIGTVVCSIANWVNGTDLCPTPLWGIGSENCPTAQWVKRTDLCPRGIALREGSDGVASLNGDAYAVRRSGSQQVEYDCRTRKRPGMWARAKR